MDFGIVTQLCTDVSIMKLSFSLFHSNGVWSHMCWPVGRVWLREVIPWERYAEPFPSKVSRLSYWSEKMRNVLTHMHKQFSVFLTFFRFKKCPFSISGTFIDEKFSLAPISFNLGSAYVPEDSKEMKKKSLPIFFFDNFF